MQHQSRIYAPSVSYIPFVAMLPGEYVYRQLQELGEPQPYFTDR